MDGGGWEFGRYYRKMEQGGEAKTLTYRTVDLVSYIHFDV